MMEVGSPTLHKVRHSDKIFSPEDSAQSPSVCTGLSLGVRADENKSASILPPGPGHLPSVSSTSLPSTAIGGYGSMSTPLVGVGSTILSSPGTVGGNQTMHMPPPDIELSPPVPIVGNAIMAPSNAFSEPGLQNLGAFRVFDNSLLRSGGNANIVMPPITAAHDSVEARVDIGDQLNMETQPASFGESQSSQPDLYNGGETQQVQNSQEGLDDTQLPLAGETQPVNNQEGFDDMVVLQNDTLTASTIPLTNGVDARPLQDSSDVPAFAPNDHAGMKALNQDGAGNISAPYLTKASTGETETSVVVAVPNERVLVTEVPTGTEHPEVHSAATGEQLGLTEASEKEGFNTPEPQLGLSHENVASLMEEKSHGREGKGDESHLSKDGEAEKDVQYDVTGKAKVLIEQEIQAIKGRKVVKKFGRKKYKGEVVDYDAENQWFKVVYEDADEEDLELVEVEAILVTEDTSANTSTAKRKRSHREGGDLDQQARKSKKHMKDHTKTPSKKSRTSRNEKGTPKKKGSLRTKRKSQPRKSPGSKFKSLKATVADMKSSELQESSSFETKPDGILDASVYESPVQSQARSAGKRKKELGVQAGTSIGTEKKRGSKSKRAGKKRTGNAKTARKSSAKRGGRKSTPKKRGTRHRSLSKLSNEESKVEKEDDAEKPKGKRLKSDVSEDQDALVGKAVEKDFDGILYSGVVAKFYKKTGFYKVKYEDGDQEDLELDELKAVLLQ